MIEVEKKFVYTQENKARLVAGAEFLGEKKIVDIYYDVPGYELTRVGKWLRSRNGAYELKVSLGADNERFDEIEDEDKIREALQLPLGGDFQDVLASNGYAVFCSCNTVREKYRKDGFVIDLDSSEFEDFSCRVMEIELMVENASQTLGALARITAFATELGLELAPTQGKIVQYLKQRRPEHYDTLLHAGIVKVV